LATSIDFLSFSPASVMYIMLPVVNQTLVGLASGNLFKPFVAPILDNQLHEYCRS